MKEIKLTQGKVTMVNDEDFEYLNQWKWCATKKSNSYYATTRSKKTLKFKDKNMILIHQIILERMLGHKNFEMVDHIDGDGLNNQRSNLRPATYQENNMNRLKGENKSSVYKGVYKHSKCSGYISQIILNRYNIYLGYFNTEEEAAEAYNKKAIELFGEYAKLNIIKKE